MHMCVYMRMPWPVSCAACGLTRYHRLLLATFHHVHSPPPPPLPQPSLSQLVVLREDHGQL